MKSKTGSAILLPETNFSFERFPDGRMIVRVKVGPGLEYQIAEWDETVEAWMDSTTARESRCRRVIDSLGGIPALSVEGPVEDRVEMDAFEDPFYAMLLDVQTRGQLGS